MKLWFTGVILTITTHPQAGYVYDKYAVLLDYIYVGKIVEHIALEIAKL